MKNNKNNKLGILLGSESLTAVAIFSEKRLAVLKALLIAVLVFPINFSCKKFINIDPPSNQLVKATVFSDDLTAKAALLGLYGKLGFGGGPTSGGQNGITLLTALTSDELLLTTVFSPQQTQFNKNDILSTNQYIATLWNTSYEYIYLCNSLIEGLSASTGVSTSLKQQSMGEALFIRAYVHFYLSNLFGKIPYITTTVYERNTEVGRLEISTVNEMIIKDLVNAKSLMSEEYPASNGRRTRANNLAASALLAKVYLFDEKYSEAESEASIVIRNAKYTLENLNSVFLTNSKEAIWQLESLSDQPYTADGNQFIGENRLSQSLNNEFVLSFETNDLRRSQWIRQFDSNGKIIYAPYK